MDRLPPLTALRAFDAAARHMSFAEAAKELNVTPAALSFQIKSLEAHLGQPVFRRLNRAVELTEVGRALAPGVADGFATLGAAWRGARRMIDSTTLVVTAGPAFTSQWLASRMYSFVQAHPEIELRLSATLRILDFERDEVDVAIRFARSIDPALSARELQADWLTPMVSPALADGIKTPEDLFGVPLLVQDDLAFMGPERGWPGWFRAVGVTRPIPGGSHFSQSDHAIAAALNGTGAILGRGSLAAREVREGRLVMPFAETLWIGASNWLVTKPGAEARPAIAQFTVWLENELSELDGLMSGRVFLNDR